jgi:hypothetical protein
LASQESQPVIRSEEFSVVILAPGVALLTFRSAHVEQDACLVNHTRRSSVWLRANQGWQLRYHQGTAAASACTKHRDSLRETLYPRPTPQRRSTAPATASAATDMRGGARQRNSPCGTVREVRPNPSLSPRPATAGCARREAGLFMLHFAAGTSCLRGRR